MTRLVIVGNGVAGATAARVARVLAPEAEVAMVSAETALPYSRPALMYVALGQMRPEDTHLYDAAFWAKNRVRRVAATVDGLDLDTRTLALSTGEALGFDRLLLATGSRPRRLGVPGEGLVGVVPLHTLDDAARLGRGLTVPGGRAVVVGGGLTGVELCEVLGRRGVGVTWLVRDARLMAGTLSEDESALAEAEVRAHGVDLRLGASVARIEGRERAEAVVLADGTRLPAGLVGVAVGVTPNVDLARAAGLAVGQGVRVSETLETSAPGVFAAGDCAERMVDGPNAPGAVDLLWYTARAMGAVAGRGLAGHPTVYDPGVPYNAAKVFEREWLSAGAAPGGLPDGWTQRAWRHDRARQAVRVVFSPDGRVAGASAFGVRLRHDVLRGWVQGRAGLGDVLAGLHAARFDPALSGLDLGAVAAALAVG